MIFVLKKDYEGLSLDECNSFLDEFFADFVHYIRNQIQNIMN